MGRSHSGDDMSERVGVIISSSLRRAYILFYRKYQYKIKYGTLLLVKKKESIIPMEITSLFNVPVTRIVNRYGPDVQRVIPIQEVQSALIGVARILGIVDLNSLRIKPMLSPLKPFEDSVTIATKDIYDKLWNFEGNLTLGKTYMGFYYDPEEDNVKRLEVMLKMSAEELITNNILIAGDRKTGKTLFSINLIHKIFSSLREPNINIIIFDPNGEYYDALCDRISEKYVLRMDGEIVLNNIDGGFGFEYKDPKGILSELGPKLGSRNAIILKRVLETLEQENKLFTLSNIRESLQRIFGDKEQGFINGFMSLLSRYWQTPLTNVLSPGRIVVIDMHRNLSYRSQIKMIASFFRELYLELLNRSTLERNIYRLLVVEDFERYVSRPQAESIENMEFSREYIINMLAVSKSLNSGIMGITSSPSRVDPLALTFMQTKFVLKILDPIEIKTITELLGMSDEQVTSLNLGEVLVFNPRFFHGRIFRILIGESM